MPDDRSGVMQSGCGEVSLHSLHTHMAMNDESSPSMDTNILNGRAFRVMKLRTSGLLFKYMAGTVECRHKLEIIITH